jgi:glycerol-3-phosphate O-acyltransferase / dihydroxyacetone phosphate acyltransferase
MFIDTSKPVRDPKLFYNILRWFTELHLRTNYKYHVIDAHKADNSSPTLFVGNHSNSAIDPLIILFSLKRKVHFIARGDVFKGWRAKLFDYFNMIPIFRKEEGPNNMVKNEESFAYIYQKLNQRSAVTIYSEGNCLQMMHVRKFRKGTARLCAEFETLNTTGVPLNIQPVGLTYYGWDKFGSDVYIHYGQPFTYSSINFSAAKTDAERIHVFNAFVESELRKIILEIPETVQPMQFLLDEIITSIPSLNTNNNAYTIRKNTSVTLYKKTEEELAYLKTTLLNYHTALKKHTLQHNNTVSTATLPAAVLLNNASEILLLLVTAPLFAIGVLLNALPFFVPRYLAQNKIKVQEFKASVRVIISFFICVVYFLLLSLIVGFATHWAIGLMAMPVSYCIGLLSYKWFIVYKKIRKQSLWVSLQNTPQGQELIALKAKSINVVTNLFT